MTTSSNPKAFALIMGLLTGVMITLALLRYVNKNRRLRTEYDEMQKIARGEAYMYGFYTLIAAEAILGIAKCFGPLPMDPTAEHFLVILIGVTVQAGYSILHDAYIGLNTETTRFKVMMIAIGLFNLFIAILAWAQGRMIKNGILQAPFVNFMVFVMCVILAVIGLVKKSRGKMEDA
ncbi:MAG: hypothetical protein IKD66_06160 [Solobacterium sp.]|nr:hypothetical protein [Solobacterium sp.]